MTKDGELQTGDIVRQHNTDGSISYSLLVLDLGKYETRVRVLDSRWYHLIGREQMWLTHILNELKG